MKLGRLLIAGLFATTAISTSAHAGLGFFDPFDISLWGVHEVSQAKLNECATDGVGGKIKCSNTKKGDVETLLCGSGGAGDNEKLALYTPCPLEQALELDICEGECTEAVAFLGVFNFETGTNACTVEPVIVELETAQIHIKDGEISQVEAIVFGEVTPYDYAASAKVDFGEVKKTDTILDGSNCAKKFRTKSLVGEKFGLEDDAVIESGKIKAGKIKDIVTASDICDGLGGEIIEGECIDIDI